MKFNESPIAGKEKVTPEVAEEAKATDKKEDILKEAIEKIDETEKEPAPVNLKVVCDVLNVRSTRNTKDRSNIIKQVKSGDILQRDMSFVDANWTKITKPVEGYVMSQYVAPVK